MPFPLAPFYVPVFPTASYTDRSCFKSLRPQWSHIGAQLYWQKFLLTLATMIVPHRSPTNTSRWLHSLDILHWQKFLKQRLVLWLPSIPVSLKASYTNRSSFWSLRPECSHIGARQIQVDEANLIHILRQPFQAMPFPLTPFDSSLSIASPNAPPRTDQGGIDTPPSPNFHLAHNPHSVILVIFCPLYP